MIRRIRKTSCRILPCSYVATGASFLQLGSIIWIFVTLVIMQIISTFFLNLHIRLQYGRHLKELKRIMDDLETEG